MKEMTKITKMGIEQYITKVQSIKAKISWILSSIVSGTFGLFLLVWGIAESIDIFKNGWLNSESFWYEIIALLIGGGVLFALAVSFLVLYVFNKNNDEYKEQLIKRHGNYKDVLRTIESQLASGDVFFTECYAYITKDWLVFLDTRLVRLFKFRPVRFIHKSEITCLVCTKEDAILILDDGEGFDLHSNENSWNEVFILLEKRNPYMLTNSDIITMPNGVQQTAAETLANGNNNREAVVKTMFETYQKNKTKNMEEIEVNNGQQ